MDALTTFDRVLDAIEHLPADQQSALIDVVQRRLAERARKRISADMVEARAEHASGRSRVTSVDDLMREIES